MNQLCLDKPTNLDPNCADVMDLAEQEFAAFFSAVTELFGSEQARLSAKDWLHELLAMDGLPASARECRLVTVAVLARLASRVNASSISMAS